MKVFTICSGQVKLGALVEKFLIQGTNTEIAAIVVGESSQNYNRQAGVLPVALTDNLLKEWQASGVVEIFFAQVGTSRTGEPMLLAQDDYDDNQDQIIGVFLSEADFCGNSNYTGNQIGEKRCRYQYMGRVVLEPLFADFPGQILVDGTVVKSLTVPKKTGGKQLVAVMPQKVFRTVHSDQLADRPAEYYYYWNGHNLVGGLTKEEWLAHCSKKN